MRQNRPEKHYEGQRNCTVVSSRVREIAKSTLHLSDLDIDEFFSDSSHDHHQKVRERLIGQHNSIIDEGI